MTTPAPVVPTPVVAVEPPIPPATRDPHFWAVIIASVLALLVALHVIGPNFAGRHEDVVNAIAVLASVLGPSIYALARSIVQHGNQVAQAQVVAAQTAQVTALASLAPAQPSTSAV